MRVARILAVSEAGTEAAIPIARGRRAAANMASSNIAFGEESVGFSLTVSFELE